MLGEFEGNNQRFNPGIFIYCCKKTFQAAMLQQSKRNFHSQQPLSSLHLVPEGMRTEVVANPAMAETTHTYRLSCHIIIVAKSVAACPSAETC